MSTSQETVTFARDNLAEAYTIGGNPEKTATFYSSWSKGDNYDQHLNPNLYRGPEIAAQAVADFFPSSKRGDAHILDVAAGTGFVAENLKKHGFMRFDALDASEGMLQKARQKGLYDNYICCYLDTNKLPILEDTYDCAVTSGGMGEGHIPYNSLDQLVRVVKPGGLVCIVMREEFVNHSQYKDLLEPYMTRLEKEGHWQKVSRTVVEKYVLEHNGVVYKFKVLPGQNKTE
ncbi:methyltransferase-like protein 27 [Aplysia californica]|uniref:Methyltransferase-like protein 27 n=1 Tax=Aplysia californica TaxID=6500 RepID=A0ABM0JEQ9_APLCA|nr:methyltransferase-like protein 27 [Aplysia californica]